MADIYCIHALYNVSTCIGCIFWFFPLYEEQLKTFETQFKISRVLHYMEEYALFVTSSPLYGGKVYTLKTNTFSSNVGGKAFYSRPTLEQSLNACNREKSIHFYSTIVTKNVISKIVIGLDISQILGHHFESLHELITLTSRIVVSTGLPVRLSLSLEFPWLHPGFCLWIA